MMYGGVQMLDAACRRQVLHAIGAALFSLPAAAGTVALPVESGGNFSMSVVSMKEARFRSTVRQQYDYSCGSAAVATLLTEHYDFPVSEQDVFEGMFQQGDPGLIRREGFSMLDMKRYLELHGFQAEGYVADLSVIEQIAVPAIVLLRENGYNHFVVVKGLRDQRVLLGDPSLGTRAMSSDRFDAMWVKRMLFVVRNKRQQARFNRSDDWSVAPLANLTQGVNRSAFDPTTMLRRAPSDF